ncbi:MAG: hypothetical protein ACRD3W_10265, partial [Terriglobales bacterium]
STSLPRRTSRVRASSPAHFALDFEAVASFQLARKKNLNPNWAATVHIILLLPRGEQKRQNPPRAAPDTMFVGLQINITRGDITFWIALVGAITGVLGFGLGLWNAWVTWRQNRIRLRVASVTLLSFPPEGGKVSPVNFVKNSKGEAVARIWGIEVINEGCPVKIKEVGYLLYGTDYRAVIMHQLAMYQVTLPHQLEQHDSVAIYADMFEEGDLARGFELLANYKCAFARTTSGKQFTGTNDLLKDLTRKCAAS